MSKSTTPRATHTAVRVPLPWTLAPEAAALLVRDDVRPFALNVGRASPDALEVDTGVHRPRETFDSDSAAPADLPRRFGLAAAQREEVDLRVLMAERVPVPGRTNEEISDVE